MQDPYDDERRQADRAGKRFLIIFLIPFALVGMVITGVGVKQLVNGGSSNAMFLLVFGLLWTAACGGSLIYALVIRAKDKVQEDKDDKIDIEMPVIGYQRAGQPVNGQSEERDQQNGQRQ